MKYTDARLRQLLAAEYVVGTLTGAARRRFERLLAADPGLVAELRYWERRLHALAPVSPVAPRPEVWTAIERRIAVPAARGRQARRQRWTLWAGLATAACLVLAVLLLRRIDPPTPPTPPPVAVQPPAATERTLSAALQLPSEDAQWTVSVVPRTRALRVYVRGRARLAAQSDYELWWLAADGVVPLGLLPRDGVWKTTLPAGVQLSEDNKVAVSLEPAGGSPLHDKPSGPVLTAVALVPSI